MKSILVEKMKWQGSKTLSDADYSTATKSEGTPSLLGRNIMLFLSVDSITTVDLKLEAG